jgi:hypothetical protein
MNAILQSIAQLSAQGIGKTLLADRELSPTYPVYSVTTLSGQDSEEILPRICGGGGSPQG